MSGVLKTEPVPVVGGRGEPALRLERREDGRLWVLDRGGEWPVVVRRAFPWSEPGRFLSLRDEENREVVMVADPAVLEPGSRAALEAALAEAGFVFEVTAVVEVVEEVEIRHWTVETRQGRRAFQTRLDDWPLGLPGGALVIRDVAGDLYRIGEPGALDRRSRALLWAFVD